MYRAIPRFVLLGGLALAGWLIAAKSPRLWAEEKPAAPQPGADEAADPIFPGYAEMLRAQREMELWQRRQQAWMEQAMPEAFQPPAIPKGPWGTTWSWRSSTSNSLNQVNGRFTYRQTVDGLTVTLQGRVAGGPQVSKIEVSDGSRVYRYADIASVAAAHRDAVQQALVKLRKSLQ